MTAVEWLKEQITFDADGERWASFIDCYDLSEFFNKAIEMEKQQIIDAYGELCLWDSQKDAEEYYNKTFKKK